MTIPDHHSVVLHSGPYSDGNEGNELHVESHVSGGARDGYSYVSLHEIGPKGGYYGGPAFYTRERVDEFISALEQARDHAFPAVTKSSR
jgi:hypothetical protein